MGEKSALFEHKNTDEIGDFGRLNLKYHLS